eukprot:scaffold304_cov248-Pinguiococcus_pyrenoidosus.AAC.12
MHRAVALDSLDLRADEIPFLIELAHPQLVLVRADPLLSARQLHAAERQGRVVGASHVHLPTRSLHLHDAADHHVSHLREEAPPRRLHAHKLVHAADPPGQSRQQRRRVDCSPAGRRHLRAMATQNALAAEERLAWQHHAVSKHSGHRKAPLPCLLDLSSSVPLATFDVSPRLDLRDDTGGRELVLVFKVT